MKTNVLIVIFTLVFLINSFAQQAPAWEKWSWLIGEFSGEGSGKPGTGGGTFSFTPDRSVPRLHETRRALWRADHRRRRDANGEADAGCGRDQSQKRVLYILGITRANTSERIVPLDSKEKFTRELDKYGLGTERTIEQYWKFAKTDPVHRSGAQQQFCSF